MMGNSRLLRGSQFTRANVQVPVQLQRIAIDDFAIQTDGELERKVALTRPGRAEDDYERMANPHIPMILGRSTMSSVYTQSRGSCVATEPRGGAQFPKKASPVG